VVSTGLANGASAVDSIYTLANECPVLALLAERCFAHPSQCDTGLPVCLSRRPDRSSRAGNSALPHMHRGLHTPSFPHTYHLLFIQVIYSTTLSFQQVFSRCVTIYSPSRCGTKRGLALRHALARGTRNTALSYLHRLAHTLTNICTRSDSSTPP
jgi:hypothetical protein